MFKNGFITLVIHGVISVISFFVFTALDDTKLAYGIASKITAVIILLGAAFAYFMLGKICLKNDLTRKSLSVWIVSFIGIFVWILTYFLSDGTIDVSLNVNWAPYCLYNAYSFPVMVVFNVDSSYYLLLFAIVPSVLLWLGMKFNNNQTE
jgi:hypothetical protein